LAPPVALRLTTSSEPTVTWKTVVNSAVTSSATATLARPAAARRRITKSPGT